MTVNIKINPKIAGPVLKCVAGAFVAASIYTTANTILKKHNTKQEMQSNMDIVKTYSPKKYAEVVSKKSNGYAGYQNWKKAAEEVLDSLQRNAGKAQKSYMEASKRVDAIKNATKMIVR